MGNTPPEDLQTEEEKPSAKEMVARLSHYLDDYSDEIPEEKILGVGKHKVRGSWFQGAINTAKFVSLVYLDNQNLLQKVTEFEVRFRNRRVAATEAMERGEQPNNFTTTTREEIDTMNALLREVRENLTQIF